MKLLVFLLCCLYVTQLADAQDKPDVFVQAEVDDTTPFVGQQLTYTFSLFDSIGLNNPLYEASDFEGFWRFDWGNVTQIVQQVSGKQYTVSAVRTALFPTTSGTFTIVPAKAILPETVFSSRRELTADPLSVEVQPLPDGAPSDFNGAVGQFEMSAIVSSLTVRLGEPVSVRLTIRGTGNVEQLQRPAISLPSGWRFYEETPTYSAAPENGQIVGTKDFEVLIFPAETGTPILPEITLSYFDPATGSYHSVSTAPITLKVISTAGDSADSNNNNSQPSSAMGVSLSIRSELDSQSFLSDSPNYTLWLLPLLIVATGVLWTVGDKRIRQYRSRSRYLNALQSAHEKLRLIQKEGEISGISDHAKRVVLEYVVDKLGTLPGHFTVSDVDNLLTVRGVPASIRLQIADLIDSINEGLYGPNDTTESSGLVKQVYEVLRRIDEVWKFW